MGVLAIGFKSTSFVQPNGEPDLVPIGSIILWSGSLASIPAGWHHCDGTNGTPNFTDRFVVNAGSFNPVGTTGGQTVHTHTFTGDGHDHSPGGVIDIHGPGAESAWDAGEDSSSEMVTGITDEQDNRPFFHAFAYIMRIS